MNSEDYDLNDRQSSDQELATFMQGPFTLKKGSSNDQQLSSSMKNRSGKSSIAGRSSLANNSDKITPTGLKSSISSSSSKKKKTNKLTQSNSDQKLVTGPNFAQ